MYKLKSLGDNLAQMRLAIHLLEGRFVDTENDGTWRPGFRWLAQEHPVVSDVVDVIGKRHPRGRDRQHKRTQQDQSVSRSEPAMTAKHELAAGEELFDFVRIPR